MEHITEFTKIRYPILAPILGIFNVDMIEGFTLHSNKPLTRTSSADSALVSEVRFSNAVLVLGVRVSGLFTRAESALGVRMRGLFG